MSETPSNNLSPVSVNDVPSTQQPLVSNGYQRANSPLTWWASGAFAAILGFSRISYGLLLPSLQADLKGSFGAYGMIGTSNLVGYLIGILVVPLFLTWYSNQIRFNTLSLILLNLFMVFSASSFDLLQMGIWRFFIGLFSAPATVLALAVALEHVEPRQRGLAAALVWMGASIGVLISGIIAPLIINAGPAFSWRTVWIAMGIIGLVVTYGYHRELIRSTTQLRAHLSSQQIRTTPTKKGRHELLETMVELLHPQKLLCLTIAYFSMGFGYIIYVYYFPSLVVQQGLSPLLVGLVWSGLGAAGIIASPIWGKFMDRWPSGWLLATNMLLGALGTIAVLTKQPEIEFFGALVFGLTLFGAGPAIVSFLLRRTVSDERYARSFSLITTIFAIGQALGPTIGGFAVDHTGLSQGTAITGLIIGLGTLFAGCYGIIQQRKQTPQQQ